MIAASLIWLFIAITPYGDVEISTPMKMERCVEKIQEHVEYGQGKNVQCVHALQTWRRITEDGPNQNELRYRKSIYLK